METSVQHPATSARSGHPIVRPLLSVTRSTRQLFGLLLADIDVVVGQDQFLLQFTDDNPKKVSEIAAALSVRPSTISKMVDVLEAKHWVTRDRDGTDLRKVLVRLTPEGVKVRTKVSTIWDDIEAQISKALAGVDESFYANLNQLDDVLARRLSRLR